MAIAAKARKRKWLRISLILILVALGIMVVAPNFIRCSCRGTLTGCKSNLKNIGTALEMYSTDHDGNYPGSLDELYPEYLRREPICPKADHSTYRASYGRQVPGNDGGYEDYYLVECTGENHDDVDYPPDFPKYNGVIGLIERPEAGAPPEQGYVQPRVEEK